MLVQVSQRVGTCCFDADAATKVGHACVDQASVEQPTSRGLRVSDLAAPWPFIYLQQCAAIDAMET
jgi:hypothetical protein